MKYYLYLVIFNKNEKMLGYPLASTEILTKSTLEFSLDSELQALLAAYSDHKVHLEQFSCSGTRAEILEEKEKLIASAEELGIELIYGAEIDEDE